MFKCIRLWMVLGSLSLLPFLATPAGATIVLDDLDHHWGFEDGVPGVTQETTTSDTVGTADGTLRDGAGGGSFDLDFSYSSKVGNVAIDFSGGIVDICRLAGTYRENFSVAMWVKADTAGGGGYGRLMIDRPASGNRGWLFNVNSTLSEDDNPNTVGIGVGCTGLSNAYSYSDAFTLGTWQHVAFTFSDSYDVNGTDTVEMNLYINGQPVSTATSTIPAAGSNFMAIGNNSAYAGTNNRAFDGLIDEVVIFNRELTDDEVSAFYSVNGDVSKLLVPEPAASVLLVVGLGLVLPSWRRRRNALGVSASSRQGRVGAR